VPEGRKEGGKKEEGRKEEGMKAEGRKKKDLLTMLGPGTASYGVYRFSVLAQSSTEMP
jgi:hypothetical protein